MILTADKYGEYSNVKCQMWSIEKYFVIYDNCDVCTIFQTYECVGSRGTMQE